MKVTTIIRIMIILITAAIASACGNANFGSAGSDPGGKSGSGDDGVSENARQTFEDDDALAAEDGDDGADASAKADGDSALDDRDDVEVVDHEADDSVVGCQHPDDVAKKIEDGRGTLGNILGLAGWGDTGGASPADLTNLNLADCSWFGLAQEAGERKYMTVFNAPDQSYAQPFPGPGTAVNHAVCLQAAVQANLALKAEGKEGTVSCMFIPL